MTWRPLITDAGERARITGVIREIVAAMPAPRGITELVDHAVLRAYLAQDGTVEDPDDASGQALTAAIDAAAESGVDLGLHRGVARVSWAVAHLASGDDADRLCATLEDQLRARLEGGDPMWDLLVGSTGLAVAALERRGQPSADRLLAAIVDQLERLAAPLAGGIAWPTPAGFEDRYMAWNLGMAHGLPAVVAILVRLRDAGVEPARCARLLDGALAALLSTAGPPSERGRFPSYYPGDPDPGPVRIAWCYGDLGVVLALQRAGHDDAAAVARALAARHPTRARIGDFSLCHGRTGAAHLFNRLWQATGDPALAEAARRWLDELLANRRTEPIAGFPGWRNATDGKTWTPEASLLLGAAGVALALHAAIGEVEPLWDRLLLADLEPAA